MAGHGDLSFEWVVGGCQTRGLWREDDMEEFNSKAAISWAGS